VIRNNTAAQNVPVHPLDQVLAGVDSTTAQPGWSPWPEPALTAAKHIVADYVSSPRLYDSSIDRITALGGRADQQALLDAGMMMCLSSETQVTAHSVEQQRYSPTSPAMNATIRCRFSSETNCSDSAAAITSGGTLMASAASAVVSAAEVRAA
jgi:hypothetical protein